MAWSRAAHVLASSTFICACAGAPAEHAPQEVSAPDHLTGRVWAALDASAAPGTFRIFLADGTLVMDSCGETYRLATWTRLGERRLEWTEDTARIQAEITTLSAERLALRVALRNESREEAYAPARVPTVCPDLPR